MPQCSSAASMTVRKPDEKTISRWSRSRAHRTNSGKPRRRPASRSTSSRTCSGVARTESNSSCIACSRETSPALRRGWISSQRPRVP